LIIEAKLETSTLQTSCGGKGLGRGVARSRSGAAFHAQKHENDPCFCRWHEFGSLEEVPREASNNQAVNTAALLAIRLRGKYFRRWFARSRSAAAYNAKRAF